jgi:hypothetical protein
LRRNFQRIDGPVRSGELKRTAHQTGSWPSAIAVGLVPFGPLSACCAPPPPRRISVVIGLPAPTVNSWGTPHGQHLLVGLGTGRPVARSPGRGWPQNTDARDNQLYLITIE